MEESVSPLLREENQRACKEREIALEDKRNNRSDSSDEESHEDDAERRLDRALLREAEAGASKDLNTAVGGDGRPTDPIVKAVLRSLELLDAGVDERGVDEVDLARKLLAKIDSEAHKAEGRKQSVWALECLVAAGLARHTVDRFHYRSAHLRAAPTSYAVRRRALVEARILRIFSESEKPDPLPSPALPLLEVRDVVEDAFKRLSSELDAELRSEGRPVSEGAGCPLCTVIELPSRGFSESENLPSR